MQALLFGHLFSFARRTVMQALVSLGLVDHDWSAFYRLFNEPRIDYEELTGCASSGRRCRTCWKRCRAFWIVSAVRKGSEWRLPYPVVELLEWAWQRWEVEVCHREMKTGFGLGEIQCWSKDAAILAVQWQARAFGVLVLAGHRAWGMSGGSIRPPGRWRGGVKRWSLGSLWRGYRAELWG